MVQRVKRAVGRPLKDANLAEIDRLKSLCARQDDVVQQARDEISDLRAQVEFYRKQVNHLLALANILARGA